MKRIIPIITILLLATFVFAAPPQHGSAGGPPPPPGAHPGFGPGPDAGRILGEYLALTDAQRSAADAIESEFRESVEPLHERMHTLHDQLEAARGGSDTAAIGALLQQLDATRAQIDAARKATDAKFSALLTAEQKTKFDAFRAAVEFLREREPGGGAHP
jgi:Spy/CpxP family protein refolding chaperone